MWAAHWPRAHWAHVWLLPTWPRCPTHYNGERVGLQLMITVVISWSVVLMINCLRYKISDHSETCFIDSQDRFEHDKSSWHFWWGELVKETVGLSLQDKIDGFVPAHFLGWYIKVCVEKTHLKCTVIVQRSPSSADEAQQHEKSLIWVFLAREWKLFLSRKYI